jgi:hypothetical protein
MSRCGGHDQRNSKSQFQQCSAHGQLRGLATIGQPGALHAGLGHGNGPLSAASARCGPTIGWLGESDARLFLSANCISSPSRRDGTEWGRRLRADAAALVHPAVGVDAGRRLCGGARKPLAGNRAQRRSGRDFGRPLHAATPAGILLAGHRCLTGAAQAWKVSIAHDLSARFREQIAAEGARVLNKTAPPSLRGETSVKSPLRRVAGAVPCAKSLRKSGESALSTHCIPFRCRHRPQQPMIIPTSPWRFAAEPDPDPGNPA